ncbi:MAG: ThuA domain-containing protein [Maribacter sp.]|nr:ThuA domain-containing protein [Maribacter sp.]
MKNKFFLLLLCSLLACGQNKEKSAVQKKENSPKEWLTFVGNGQHAERIVFISGDEEYRSEEALPQLAKIMAKQGFNCTVLFAQNPDAPGTIDPNYVKNIPGLDALATADLMVIFTRFRDLPDDQMHYIDAYLKAGKPVVGIRTATHAFNFEGDSILSFTHYGNGYSGDKPEWTDGFGRLVLGEKWIAHHGNHKNQSTRGVISKEASSQPITNGLDRIDIWGSTDVYGVRLPLPGDSQPIILGQVTNRAGEYDEADIFYGMKPSDTEIADKNEDGLALNSPMMPIAWTKSYELPEGKPGRAFTSTIGSSSDLLSEGVRRLLVNGMYWAMDLPVPEKADVDLVGEYHPSAYGFKTDAFWQEKQLKVADFE